MFETLAQKLPRILLKQAAMRQIFCPQCSRVLDQDFLGLCFATWRQWDAAGVEGTRGKKTLCACLDCFEQFSEQAKKLEVPGHIVDLVSDLESAKPTLSLLPGKDGVGTLALHLEEYRSPTKRKTLKFRKPRKQKGSING